MVYVFDTNSLRVLGNYYPGVFPTFWNQFDQLVSVGRVGSVREVKKELDLQSPSDHLLDWCDRNQTLFPPPSEAEMKAVADIFSIPHFRQLIGEKQRLRGQPVADPFIVARARILNAQVITEEAMKVNAAKIPNVCQHFGVACTNVQGFLTQEGWQF